MKNCLEHLGNRFILTQISLSVGDALFNFSRKTSHPLPTKKKNPHSIFTSGMCRRREVIQLVLNRDLTAAIL